MKDYSNLIAKAGLHIGAIKLSPAEPFQWASGYRMPIYNDNRMFLFYPEYRLLIISAFENVIEEQNIDYDVIAGTSTAGIPWASFLAQKLDKPMIYIRDKPKDHGLRNQIEGLDADKGLEEKKVIVIEDLISTGGSSAAAVQAVRNANGIVEYCLSIFNYGLDKAVEEFASLDPSCNVISLISYDALLKSAMDSNYISEDDIDVLQEWGKDPFQWGENHGFPQVKKQSE
jgi:orotate phosphoribosyltransferase